MDIRTKIVLTLIAVALSSIGVFAYLAYLLSAEMFLQNAGRQLSAVAASQAREAEFVLDQWHAQVEALARSDELGVANASTSTKILQQMLTSPPTRDLRWLSIYDASGIRRATTRPDLAPRHLPVGTSDASRIAGARLLPDGVAVVLAAPLATQAGTLQAGFGTDSIDAIAAAHPVGETGTSLLLAPAWTDSDGSERTGYVIVSPRWDTSARSGPLAAAPGAVAAALTEQGTAVQAADFLGTPVMASSRALGKSDWRLLVTVDRDEELAWVDQLLLQLRDLGLFLGAVVIIGAVVLGLFFARRIRRLAETVDRIRHGELELRAEIDGEDEVTLLARSLNEFMDQLHRSGDIFQLGSLRVLVADSLARNRALLLELLSNWRMQPTLAADGASALAALDAAQAAGEPIQLLVLDQTLPDMAGTELAAQLRTRQGWQRCPIIMLVSDPETLNVSEAKRLGVGHMLPTPVIASDLMEATLAEMGVSAPAMAAMPDVLLPQTEPRKILLAEDSDIIARVTSGFLERWGHAVTVAGTGRLAVDHTRQEAFDLVLMDLEMPEMSGFDATRMIRQDELDHDTRTPIVALTARANKQDREACMEAGMDDYLCKPVDPKLLYGLVNAHPATALASTPASPITQPIREPHMTNQPTQADNSEDSPIDWTVAQSLTAGDAELLSELVELFPVESAKHLDSVRQAIGASDAEALTRAAHTLKSSAGFFGAPKLVATALQVENLGKAADFEAARQCLAALEAETTRLTAALATEHPPQGGQT